MHSLSTICPGPLAIAVLMMGLVLPMGRAHAGEGHGVDFNFEEPEATEPQQPAALVDDGGDNRGKYIGRPSSPSKASDPAQPQSAQAADLPDENGNGEARPAPGNQAPQYTPVNFNKTAPARERVAGTTAQPQQSQSRAFVGPPGGSESTASPILTTVPERRNASFGDEAPIPPENPAEAASLRAARYTQMVGDLEQAAVTVATERRLEEKEKAARKATRAAIGKAPSRLLDQVHRER